MIRVTAGAIAAVILSGCNTLPTEQRLIGTWQMSADQVEDERGVMHRPTGREYIAENTLRPDHTYTSTFRGHRGVTTGRWSLRDRWLLYEFPTRTQGRRVVERNRVKIVKLSSRELLVIDERGRDGDWTRVR